MMVSFCSERCLFTCKAVQCSVLLCTVPVVPRSGVNALCHHAFTQALHTLLTQRSVKTKNHRLRMLEYNVSHLQLCPESCLHSQGMVACVTGNAVCYVEQFAHCGPCRVHP